MYFRSIKKFTYLLYSIFNLQFIIYSDKSPELPPAPVILPPIQYTLKELETDILNNSLSGVNALKKATESLKGI